MSAENVIEYYVLCNKLKNLIRTGWKVWNVKRDRLESVAEHIYSTQMLALAMYSEYQYDIDINKVILMLAIHETEETIIGDFTPFEISEQEKKEIGHKAVLRVLEPLKIKDKLIDLIYEFDNRSSKEAHFAYMCDKLECDLQCKIYDEEQCVDLKENNDKTNEIPQIEQLIKQNKSWSDLWINNDLEKIDFDDNFSEVAKFALRNKIGNNL